MSLRHIGRAKICHQNMAEGFECHNVDSDENMENSSDMVDEDTPMETDDEIEFDMKQSSSLQQMISSIADERSKEFSSQRLQISEDDGFVLVARGSFWVDLFTRYILEAPDDDSKDDLLFYVRKTASSSKLNIPRTEIEVYRKSSKSKPPLEDEEIDWEETVYLNIILQHFEYHVTCAICTRTGERELQILKKFKQRVYASPSKRQMDGKGTEEEITYPNIFFTVDNFEEAFGDIIVRDSEMVVVELTAQDRHGTFQGVLFLGSIRYDALKKVYDTRASLSQRMAQRMSLSWFKGHKRVEFVRMRGPQAKGHAEMAVSRVKGSGPETPDQTPNTEAFPAEDFEQEGNQYNQRRMSDPSQSWHHFLRGSFKKSGIRKSRSEAQNVDVGANGCAEVEANNIVDEFDEEGDHYNGFFGKSFGQAWHWFKEKRRANCVALHSFLTYITLPWHRIIADVIESRQEPVLTFNGDQNHKL